MKFSQWTVWLADLDPIVGSEQGKTRPVLIVSKSSLNTVHRNSVPNMTGEQEKTNEHSKLCYSSRSPPKEAGRPVISTQSRP
jgi:mRNA-degrading endonuclease toxin of MazEF toxin-antitoxin module